LFVFVEPGGETNVDTADVASISKQVWAFTIDIPLCKCANCTDACAGKPCKNQELCTVTGTGSTYACTCAGGWTGTDCTVNIDDCATSPCLNGGT
jgi:hypothetical protein